MGPLFGRANRNGFSRRGIPIADDVDKLVGQLVDLAEARLRPSRRLLSRRSAIHVASNSGLKAGGQGNVTTPPQPQPH